MSRLDELVPGGCHTYSKGADRYAPNAPATIVRGAGGRVLGSDDQWYVDWSMGINNVLIGHAEESIDDAAVAALRGGQAFGRPSDLEEAAAEAVLRLYPQGEMIKFCKNGSDANNAAIRLARAVTGRQHLAYDATAPFFSIADWFVGGWPAKTAGTLDAERAFAHGYTYNDPASVHAVCARRRPAAIIVELARTEQPTTAFLDALRAWQREGVLLIVDEIVTGYRYAQNGLAPVFGIQPDLFTLGKGMANGYALAALCGRRDYMVLGASDVFLLSTTNGAERSALAAAIATAEFYETHDVIGVLAAVGAEFSAAVNRAAQQYGCSTRLRAHSDYACRPRLISADAATVRQFATVLAARGILLPLPWVCPCYRREAFDLRATTSAIDEAMSTFAEGVKP